MIDLKALAEKFTEFFDGEVIEDPETLSLQEFREIDHPDDLFYPADNLPDRPE